MNLNLSLAADGLEMLAVEDVPPHTRPGPAELASQDGGDFTGAFRAATWRSFLERHVPLDSFFLLGLLSTRPALIGEAEISMPVAAVVDGVGVEVVLAGLAGSVHAPTYAS
jgi:hypothetical protein